MADAGSRSRPPPAELRRVTSGLARCGSAREETAPGIKRAIAAGRERSAGAAEDRATVIAIKRAHSRAARTGRARGRRFKFATSSIIRGSVGPWLKFGPVNRRLYHGRPSGANGPLVTEAANVGENPTSRRGKLAPDPLHAAAD